jgi:hypothetical protein
LVELANPGRKVVDLIPPRQSSKSYIQSLTTTPSPTEEAVIVPQTPVNTNATLQIVKSSDDPVYIMMSKSKKSSMEIDMVLNISLPPKSLYDVAKESFENGDEKTLEYIIESLDISEIKRALKEGIKNMYEKDMFNSPSDISLK